MRKFAIAAVAVLAIAGSTAVYACHKLSAEQDKLSPPVEAAVRDFAKLRIDRANARMNASRDDSSQKPDDPVTRLRDHADNMATMAAAMKKIADAADPLYKTLDDSQKRRLSVLTRMERWSGRGGWRHHEHGMGMGRMGMDRDFDRDHDRRGHDRNRYDRDDGPDRGGPERL